MDIVKEVAQTVDNALDSAKSSENFVTLLQNEGYNVRLGGKAKTITFTHPSGKRVRNKKLFGITRHDCSTEGIFNYFGMDSPTNRNVRFFNSLQGISEYCKKNGIEENGQRVIYVLGLEHNLYYVGQTGNFMKRMKRHFASNKGGSQWTEQHVPVSLFEVIDMVGMDESSCALYETAKTIQYMERYGVNKVRGGDFCSLDYAEILRLLKTHGYEVKDQKPLPKMHEAIQYTKAIDALSEYKVLTVFVMNET